MENTESESSPRKRQKLSTHAFASTTGQPSPSVPSPTMEQKEDTTPVIMSTRVIESEVTRIKPMLLAQEDKEASVGITEYIDPTPTGFKGTLKKRYTDFLVNEIALSGNVVHLTDLKSFPSSWKKPETRASPPNGHASQQSEPTRPTKQEQPQDVKQNGTTSMEAPAAVASQESSEKAAATAMNENEPPKQEGSSNDTAPVSDEELLVKFFGAETATSIQDLFAKIKQDPRAKPSSFPAITSPPVTDRQLRTTIHKEIRRIFNGRVETSTDDDGHMIITCAGQGQRQPHGSNRWPSQPNQRKQRNVKVSYQDRGGDFLHFSVYKENKDSMEVVSFIARLIGAIPRNLQFAGTKDRRAATVQRMSIWRTEAEKLVGLNKSLKGSKLGDFSYHPTGLSLGDLKGNEFIIVLRDCIPTSSESILDAAALQSTLSRRVEAVATNGFINYFGLQRFGSFVVSTDTIGKMLLRGDLKAACDALTHYEKEVLDAALSPDQSTLNDENISRDDKARARALFTWKVRGEAQRALRDLPRKFSAERALIDHLSRPNMANDFMGALEKIPRSLKLMYVHAYQSLVWNQVVSERWKRHGKTVVEGDLVLLNAVDKEQWKAAGQEEAQEVDEAGEVVIRANATSSTTNGGGDDTDGKYEQARTLSAEEAASGKYTIFDIVLPTPGFDVVYPPNAIGEVYKTLMAADGLDPHAMRRQWKTISLSGNYRHVFARPLQEGRKVGVEVREYEEEDEQFVRTDLDLIYDRAKEKYDQRNGQARPGGEGTAGDAAQTSTANDGDTTGQGPEAEVEAKKAEEEKAKRLALILRFQLGASQYATMLLRELIGPGGIKTHKADHAGPK